MPRCKNYDAYYTGNEPSPRGIGYHAQGEELGAERIGKNQTVWHVVEFGPKKTKRWMRGQSLDSRFLKVNQLLHLPAHPLGIGLLHPNMDPYKETSWSCYTYEVVNSNCIRIVQSDLGIKMRPMLTKDFVELYKKVHGPATLQTI